MQPGLLVSNRSSCYQQYLKYLQEQKKKNSYPHQTPFFAVKEEIVFHPHMLIPIPNPNLMCNFFTWDYGNGVRTCRQYLYVLLYYVKTFGKKGKMAEIKICHFLMMFSKQRWRCTSVMIYQHTYIYFANSTCKLSRDAVLLYASCVSHVQRRISNAGQIPHCILIINTFNILVASVFIRRFNNLLFKDSNDWCVKLILLKSKNNAGATFQIPFVCMYVYFNTTLKLGSFFGTHALFLIPTLKTIVTKHSCCFPSRIQPIKCHV